MDEVHWKLLWAVAFEMILPLTGVHEWRLRVEMVQFFFERKQRFQLLREVKSTRVHLPPLLCITVKLFRAGHRPAALVHTSTKQAGLSFQSSLFRLSFLQTFTAGSPDLIWGSGLSFLLKEAVTLALQLSPSWFLRPQRGDQQIPAV